MRRGWAALLLPACVVALALALLPPLPQPLEDHDFADARAWLGMPNFLNVVSSLVFLSVAGAGLSAVLHSFSGPDPPVLRAVLRSTRTIGETTIARGQHLTGYNDPIYRRS